MQWKLKEVGDTEWKQDDSGYYTLIHYVKDNIVRLDWMDKDDMPIISFQGAASDVRKHAVRWPEFKYRICEGGWLISREHASYIGAELIRCAILRSDYVQD